MKALRKIAALALVLILVPAVPAAQAPGRSLIRGETFAPHASSVQQHSVTSRPVKIDDVGALLQPAELYGSAF